MVVKNGSLLHPSKLEVIDNRYSISENPKIMTSVEIAPPSPLSGRELEIIAKIADGFRTKEIAELLFISPATVKIHRKNIIRKMNVANASAAVSECLRAGLI